jgi:hypothetical protein
MSQYIIYLLPNNVLQKTKLNTLESIAAERLHNSTCNRLWAITHLEYHIEVLQSLLQLLSSRFEWQGKIARLSILMVGTQQVQELNDTHAIISRIKL